MKYSTFLSVLPLLTIITISCEKEKNPVDNSSGYSKGIFVINEGSYNSNNGSVSYVGSENSIIINNIFEAANSRPLGDIVQSLCIVNDSLGFIVVNNSAKLEVVRLSTFEAVTEPFAITYPRYFLQSGDEKGYLTSGSFQGSVLVFDLLSYEITDSISVGFGPETMLLLDNRVFVANSGGWGLDSTISVISTASDAVSNILYTAKCPVDMVFDDQKFLWVYCRGYTNYADVETEAYIQKINPDNGAILVQEQVGRALDYAAVPARCASSPDGSVIYFTRPDGIYSIDAETPVFGDEPLISGSFYGLEVNPEDGNIYVFESSFTGNGTMKVYDQSGTLISTGDVGIGPNGAVFNL